MQCIECNAVRHAGPLTYPIASVTSAAETASVSTVMATFDVTTCVSVTTDYSSFTSLNSSNNNNNSSISSLSGAVNDLEVLMNDVIGIWLTGCICLLGVAGNVISFVVLQRAFGVQSPMFHVLRAMSVSDSVFLLAVFVVQSAVNAYQYFGLQHLAENYRGYVQYGVWPLLMTTQVRDIVSVLPVMLFNTVCITKLVTSLVSV